MPTHDSLTAADLSRLTDAVSREGLSRLEWSLDGFDVQIEWDRPAEAAAPSAASGAGAGTTAPAPPQPSAKTAPTGPTTLRAASAGTIEWEGGTPPAPGDLLKAGQLLATISAGPVREQVLCKAEGRVLHCQPIASGSFVCFAQWLVSVEG